MSAFGIGTNTQRTDAGKIRGTQIDIACACWFAGQTMEYDCVISVNEMLNLFSLCMSADGS
ncbi:hypothetical protein [Anaerocolumna aminovalerica]|uniref:hypothetical protein n=1 Tax=Anaerocolumna aminovalerica TaxID=1527 RepID=UPI001C0ED5B2|nr:hypothetical protein [Anaerocolumna aminovalerica]MBU5332399.1 hypothetical protein [Anaerocolumna aminovalerica]